MERETSPYDGYLDHGGKAGRHWLAEFRTDIGAVIEALDVWQETAYSIACEAHDCNFSPGTRLKVPWWFTNLTSIIALWCDVELHIDPSTLCEFRRRLGDFVPRKQVGPKGKLVDYRIAMTDEEIEEVFWKARETFDRVFHATLASLTVYVRFGVVSSTVVSVCVFSNGRSGWLACDG